MKRVLIANRGEIAVRIVRACNELDLCSVAIYSDVDRYALHVKRASEAYGLGPETSSGYLNIHRIIDIAKMTRCDAIHPGYGFLSENAEFARACEQAGVEFVGPSADIIEKMGSKVEARAAMIAAGLPVIPGSEGNLASIEEARVAAEKIGYPVMLKATLGGGGRGIRLCHNREELDNAYPRVQSEASKAFGDARLFLEKFLSEPRHIEVQILGDKHGNIIHCFERDCSIQRRHQKLIEIAPSPQINQALRDKICDYGIQAARAVGYYNAGTVEFLVDGDDNIYFLEMNTRLQVEHPVTEQITGLDLVQLQLLVAQGARLAIEQDQIKRRGFAIDFRINAEDPKNDFLPSFGKITQYYAPGGPGVRTDSAIYTGYEVPSDYDSLCAKLSVWGLDWPSALRRSKRALEEMRLRGVKTTIPYYLEILKTQDFINASFDTGFVEAHPELSQYSERTLPQHKAAVLAAALAAYQA